MATDLSEIDVNEGAYALLFEKLNAQLEAMMTGFVADVTGQPADALKLNRTTRRWETWDEGAGQWVPAVDRYDIDVTRLNGRLAATAPTASTIVERLADGRIKAATPVDPNDVARAFEIAQHVQAANPHGMNAVKVGLGNVANKRQLDRDQNLADILDKDAARGPSGLDLGTAARLHTGTQAGRIPRWEDLPTVPDATTATSGRARFGTVLEHRNGASGVAATPAGVRQMGFASDDALLGGGSQNWYDMKSSRSAGTNYYNNTGRPIQVFISNSSSNNECIVHVGRYTSSMQSLGFPSANNGKFTTITVPPGFYYRVSGSIYDWKELR